MMAVDIIKIQTLIERYFKPTGIISIDPNTGMASCSNDVIMNKRIDRLPVRWDTVGGSFSCKENQLTSLAGAPGSVGGSFICSGNQLTSLAGAPHQVGGAFYCDSNQLSSLEGAPRSVGGGFYCSNNPLTSLEGLPEEINGIVGITYLADLPLLRLFMIRGIEGLALRQDTGSVEPIINRHLPQGKAGLSACATELIKEIGRAHV